MPLLTESAGTWPGQRSDARHAEAAFHDCSLALRERRRSAIGPGEEFGAVVGGEDDDGVIVHAHVLEILHHQGDVVIELGHAGFLFRPAILRVARRFPFRGEMGDDVHARRVEPAEERLAVLLGLVHELDGEVADLVIHRLHPLRIKRAGVLDLLFADLAPARHRRSDRPSSVAQLWTMLRGPTTFNRFCG